MNSGGEKWERDLKSGVKGLKMREQEETEK